MQAVGNLTAEENFSRVFSVPQTATHQKGYNSVNIEDEGMRNDIDQKILQNAIQKERKMAFNACALLKMEVDLIGDFFFGKSKKKEDSKVTEDKYESEHKESSLECSSESEDEDKKLSSFYQSNTREELQNELKNINFADQEEEKEEELQIKSKDDEFLDSLINGLNEDTDERKYMFSSGNAEDLDFDALLKRELAEEEDEEMDEIKKKAKMDIKRNHDLEIEDLENDDDLVTGGMDINYDILREDRQHQEGSDSSEDEEDDAVLINNYKSGTDHGGAITGADINNNGDTDFFDNIVMNLCGGGDREEKDFGNVAGIQFGRRHRNRTKDKMDQILDEIAKNEKIEPEETEKNNNNEEEEDEGNKRDIYIKQRDQYLVDDEEVYVNELETGNCDWTNVRDLFSIMTDHSEYDQENEHQETIFNYFFEICEGIMKTRSEDFLAFVYINTDVMDGLVRNVEFEGVQKVLASVLNLFESCHNLNSFRFLKHRFGLYRRLLREILAQEDGERMDQMTKIFLQLVKKKQDIIDANYFIDKILLDNENHVAILDRVLSGKNALLTELASFIVKRVVPTDDKNFLEENSDKESSLHFSRVLNQDKEEGMEFQLDGLGESLPDKEEPDEIKKISNQTTAEVSMNIVFDVYDPLTLKKNHFTSKILPRVQRLKGALFGEESLQRNDNPHFQMIEDKGLKSISESCESNKEEEDDNLLNPKGIKEIKTFCIKKQDDDDKNDNDNNIGINQKEFVIDFGDMDMSSPKSVSDCDPDQMLPHTINPFEQTGEYPLFDNPDSLKLEETQLKEKDKEDYYDLVNRSSKFKMSVVSNSSGYSKENLILNLTPRKPKKSSIHVINSSDKKVYSEMKNKLQHSTHSRPSFLDRRTSIKDRSTNSRDVGTHWKDLSVNTQDLVDSDRLSLFDSSEKQTIFQSFSDIQMSKEQRMLLKELIRQNTLEKVKLLVVTFKKYSFMMKQTLSSCRVSLLKSIREHRAQSKKAKPSRSLKGRYNKENLSISFSC